jgi:alpha-ketoglutarate-dependent taurine dioxygenase
LIENTVAADELVHRRRSLAEEPKVRRLCAGGRWIRTSGSARDKGSVPRFCFDGRRRQPQKTPPVLHPLVHIHPITERKALYLDFTTTTGIDWMQEASGSALLKEI